ncbi:MAG TPA: GAF domain-containing protein [Rhodanobacteraceae bacterium]
MRGLTEPGEVQRVVCEALAQWMECDRVSFAEIGESEDSALVLPDYHRPGLSSVAGSYDLGGMDELLASMRDGLPLVVDDVDRDPLPTATWTLMRSLGIRALAANGLIKHGRLAWALVAAHSHPREWQPEQVSLMAEVAERTWEAVQRAQALTAVREAREQAEQHARTLDSTLSSVLDLVFRYTPDGRFDYANQALLDLWGVTREQAIGKSMAELGYAPETEQIMLRDLAQVVATRAPVEGETHYTSPVGVPGYFTYKLAPIFDAAGEVKLIAGTALDITARKRSELLLTEQKNMLEMIATGVDLAHCLEELTESVSRLDEHARAAVLLADEDRRSFKEIHAARIPGAFGDAVRGAPIGERADGTCSAAVFNGRSVICADIARDEQWSLEWRDVALANGMRAVYSTPIFDAHGNAIGSFFIASDHVGEPDAWHRRIAEFGAHVASIAIASSRAEAAVRESEAELADELADTRLLQSVSTELLSETDPDALYSRIVDASAALMRSDGASLRMFHPERGAQGELRLLAQRGFSEDAAHNSEWLKVDSSSICGLALQRGKRIIIRDVRKCSDVAAPGAAGYERAGVRAVQTMPLFSRAGKLVGTLSIHWREPHEPSPRRLGLLEVLGRQAADLIEGRRAEQKLVELNNFLERRVAERTAELVESERRVRDMASQLTMAEHAERRRISQILHDDLQQQLHSIQMKLASARNALGRGEEAKTLRHLTDAEQWSGEGVETARRLTVDLSPPILKSEGLAEALEWLVTQMREMHGLHVTVTGDRDLRMHDDAQRVLIYQIVRELLFNIVKHAGTDRAQVELRRDEDTLNVCVLDQGKGFEPEELRKPRQRADGGFGLTSAYERLNLLGGSIDVDSAPGLGTAIVLHVPLQHHASVEDAVGNADERGSEVEDLFG